MSEVGEIITFHDDFESIKSCKVEVIMTITKERRRVELFKPTAISSAHNQYIYNIQAEAIKAFMEEG